MNRITVDPNICSGKPTITGTRIMVTNILGMFAGGYNTERILQAYPELDREDISAALKYAGQVIDEDKVLSEANDPASLSVLLDQNVPREIGSWLRRHQPAWKVVHTSEVELQGKSDAVIFAWA